MGKSKNSEQSTAEHLVRRERTREWIQASGIDEKAGR